LGGIAGADLLGSSVSELLKAMVVGYANAPLAQSWYRTAEHDWCKATPASKHLRKFDAGHRMFLRLFWNK
jgi:hypothetical protein